MYKILTLALGIYICLNMASSQETTVKQCYFCHTDDITKCALPMRLHGCNDDNNKCIEFAGLNQENKPFFIRRCYQGDCKFLEKHNPTLKAVHCKSCDKTKCNNGTIPDVKPMKEAPDVKPMEEACKKPSEEGPKPGPAHNM